MVKIIILRHGESQWNHESRFCGWTDVPLLARGREEAAHAGDLILNSGLKPVVMFTLKLTRSNETGVAILARVNRLWCDHIKSWRLNERHYGALQGVKKSVVYSQLGKDQFDYIRRDYNGKPPAISKGADPCVDARYDDVPDKTELPRAESLHDVLERFVPYFRTEIFAHYKARAGTDGAILIVTHGSIVRAFVKHFTGVSDADILKINIPTGVPMVFEMNDAMEVIGQHYYLDEEAASRGIQKVANEGKL